jgi:hypothetical protein
MAAVNEIGADRECLRKPLGARLRVIADLDAEPLATAEQLFEHRQVVWCRDQQNVPDTGQHQRAERIIDHRLIIDRQQLLRQRARHRIQPRAAAASQDDPLHATTAACLVSAR